MTKELSDNQSRTYLGSLSQKDFRFYAQQFSAYSQGGTPIGIKDRSLSRALSQGGPVKRSKASSRTIRRAVAKQKKKNQQQEQNKGF